MTKISGLAAVTDVLATDEYVLARAGTTKKIDAVYLPGFEVVYTQFTSAVGTTATVEASATTIVTAGAFTADGTSSFVIEFWCQKVTLDVTSGTVGEVVVNLFQDAADIGRIGQMEVRTADREGMTMHCMRRMTPASGSRTYSIRSWLTVAGSGNFVAGAGGSATTLPGFIRITAV